MREAPEDQGFHQGALHRAGQQVERRAAGGELLGQVPPALTLHHNVRPGHSGRSKSRSGNKRTAGKRAGDASSPLPLLHQRHQQVHSVVGQVGLRAPHGQVVDHLLQQVSHDPLRPLRVGAERCAQRDADLKREE